MSRTESRTIKCFACFNEISLKVTLSVWNSKEFEYCIERAAERMGFRPTDKGPACQLHVGTATVREREP